MYVECSKVISISSVPINKTTKMLGSAGAGQMAIACNFK